MGIEMQVKVKKVYPDAELPVYATEGAACFDLKAYIPGDGHVHLIEETAVTIETGLIFEVPEGHVMLIHSRSGHGFGFDTRLSNATGVIDSDFRGSPKVKLTRDFGMSKVIDGKPLVIKHGDRIAQAMIIPVDRVSFVEVEDLSETARGAGGLGSTGQ
jgi:dUTP pyrophosphatase